MAAPLVADHVLEYPGGYTRSVGPVIGRFLTSLRDGRIEGVRVADGRVLVPPTEYDPVTSDPIGDDWVEVGPGGDRAVVDVGDRTPARQAAARPPVRVRARSAPTAPTPRCCTSSTPAAPTRWRSGMRVAPRWRAERVGSVRDIEACVPLTDGEEPQSPAPNAADAETTKRRHGDRLAVPARVQAQRGRGDDPLPARPRASTRSSAGAHRRPTRSTPGRAAPTRRRGSRRRSRSRCRTAARSRRSAS